MALERERQRSMRAITRCNALEKDLDECAMSYEVILLRQRPVRVCRLLSSLSFRTVTSAARSPRLRLPCCW